MMDFGMPTLIELPAPAACAVLCRDLGLQFVELNMNLPQYQTDAMDAAALQRIAAQNGIYYTIHLDENLDPCNFNPRVSAAWTQTALDAVEMGKKLQAPVLNMHLNRGVYFTLPEGKVFLYEQEKERYLTALTVFRDAITKAVEDSGICICVENTDGFDQAFLKEGLDRLLESPVFALTLDVGHDASIGGLDLPLILARKERLTHMHLHDCAGKKAHLPLGEGSVLVCERLSLAKEMGCRVVLETKTVEGLKKSVQWMKTTL